MVTILSLARHGVVLVSVGLLLAIGAGFSAIGPTGHSYTESWLIGAYVLIGWMLVVGAVTGRMDRKTRELAEVQHDQDKISKELQISLRDPVSIVLNTSMILSIFIILGLMIWQP